MAMEGLSILETFFSLSLFVAENPEGRQQLKDHKTKICLQKINNDRAAKRTYN